MVPLAVLLALMCGSNLHGRQQGPETRGPMGFPPDSGPMGPISREAVADTGDQDVRAMEARAHQLDRQNTLHKSQTDANKLLSLVTELNAEIEKGGGDSLTAAEEKQLAQIRKLAHSVKSKLSDYARGY